MRNLKITNVMIGFSILMLTAMFSCQKDLLPEPQLNQMSKIDSTRTLVLSPDTTKQTIIVSTDPNENTTKAGSITVDYLKTFSPKAGDNDYFILKSNTSWKIASFPSWVTVSPLSGTGNAHVTVTVSQNTGAQRSDVITISGTGVTKNATINVLQLAGSTAASTLTVDWLKTFSYLAGDNDYFIVTSNTSWKIASAPSWVTVSPTSGTGTAHVTVTVQTNTGAQRTGSISVSGTGIAQNASINVLQVAGVAAVVATVVPATTTTTQAETANYYVAVNGSDSNPGTIDKPFATLTKAWSVVQAGQLIYMRGGTYAFTSQQSLTNKSGSAGNLIRLWAYPGETPVITYGSGYTADWGVDFLYNNYVHVKGLTIANCPQKSSANLALAFWVRYSNHCTFEQINYHHNGGPFGFHGDCTDNLFLNCDFHDNYDPYTAIPGDNADGINGEISSGTNTFRGCRSWNNSDDGFDFYRTDGVVIFDGCWAWHNGYKSDGTKAINGTGFKLGISSSDLHTTLLRIVENCMAWDNRQGGIYQTETNGICHFYNNTTYKNLGVGEYTAGIGFGDFANIVHVVKNNIAFGEMLSYVGNSVSVQDHNSWNSGYTVTANDFVSLDPTGVDGARQADGSLPVLNFLKLKTTSPLYQNGTNVGLAYSGNAPSIGAN